MTFSIRVQKFSGIVQRAHVAKVGCCSVMSDVETASVLQEARRLRSELWEERSTAASAAVAAAGQRVQEESAEMRGMSRVTATKRRVQRQLVGLLAYSPPSPQIEAPW